jgi:CBS domain-containing protein
VTETTDVTTTPISVLTGDDVLGVAPDASLHDVARALVDGEVGAVVVRDDKTLAIASERDVVRAVAEGRDLAATRVIDIATKDLVWCDATATIGEVAAEMAEHYIRHVLVEQDGELVGIVSARDVLGAYAATEVGIDED